MTFAHWNLLLSTLLRMGLLGVMFAVLWVKEYLWWAFGLALLLYGFSAFTTAVSLSQPPPDEEEIDDPEEDEDLPPHSYRTR